jgi:dTDP-4-dehydrorhamnose reductase
VLMFLLLGATGYIGQAFAKELSRRGKCFIPLSRSALDYTRFELLFNYVRKIQPKFLINAAGFSGRPNIDGCETERMKTFQANTLLPQTIARVCLMTNTPLGHVSSGCIYSGAKVFENGDLRLEKDLGRAEVRALFDSSPERFFGFTELDEPNSSFRNPPCSFHSGTKALAEEALRGGTQTYIWRCRLPFNQIDHPCNLLTKLQSYDRVYDHITSVSHLDDFVAACLDLVEAKASFGIYNVTNPGAVTTRHVADLAQSYLKPGRSVNYWASDDEFYRSAKAPRSSCILDVTKLLRAGVRMRSAEEAIEDALSRWQLDSRREWRRLLDEVPA